MLLVLYGPDTYRSRRKLNEIIGEYRKKAGGDLNFHRIDVEDSDPADVKKILEMQSLFSPKKLVVVEHVFTQPAACDVLEPALRDVEGSRNIVVILWDRGLDAQSKVRIKKIEELASRVQEFNMLSRDQTRRWIHEEAKKRGVRLYPALMTYLDMKGSDLWALSNELNKLAVSGLSATSYKLPVHVNVFSAGDTFFSSRRAALQNILHLLHGGHDEHNLFSYLANHTRTLLTVKSFSEKRQSVPNSFGIHPYVVKKASSIVRPLSVDSLHFYLRRFFEEDLKIKIGLSKPKESLFTILFKEN